MSGRFTVVIPARYDSTRLPGKAIIDLAGKPMVQRTCEQASASGASRVVIATDDERVREALAPFGSEVRMTSSAHPTGTDRVAEVVASLGLAADEVVVNLQGDEPLIPPAVVEQVAANLHAHPEADMSTLCEPIESDRDLFDPSVVKVVFDHRGMALYFSRAPIPWYRDAFGREPGVRPPGSVHWRHIGIYGFRAGFLSRYVALERSVLEEAEALEQLRALHHGACIHVAPAREPPGPGIDTPADLERVRALL